MLTLATCAESTENRVSILSQAAKRAAKAQEFLKASFKSKILIKNKNTAHHILQKRHCWDKVVKITGNVDEDIKTVLSLLEELRVYDHKYLIESPVLFPSKDPKILKTVYNISYKGETIHAVFEMDIEGGKRFLQDAFVRSTKRI